MNESPKKGNRGRILLITRYFPPLDSTATSRMYSWAKYLHLSGFSVSVLTTSKQGQVVKPVESDTSDFRVFEVDYFDPIVFAGLDKKKTLDSIKEKSPTGSLKKKFLSKLTKIYREQLNERMPGRTDPWILPAVRKLRQLKREGQSYDYIISSYGPPSAHIVGYFAKKLFSAFWAADYRDLWLENHIYVGLWPFTYMENCIEKKIISRADTIISVSRYLTSVLQSKFPDTPSNVIENGFDREEIESSHDNFFDKDIKKFRIVYTGSIFRGKRDPSPLFKAVRELVDSGSIEPGTIEILFWGSVQGDIEELIQKFNLSSLAKFAGAVPKTTALSIQKSADALLFLEWSESEDKDIFTAKVFEYLAVDCPVLALGISSKSNIGRLIETSGSGIACGNDVNKTKEALMQLMNKSFILEKNWDLINNFSRKSEVDRLISCLRGESVKGIEF